MDRELNSDLNSLQKASADPSLRQSMKRLGERGQIIVEYVLLLVIVVGVAAILTRSIVSRSPDSPGFVVQLWGEILTTIGEDRPDDPRLPD